MEALRHLCIFLPNAWRSLSQGARDNVVGTIIGGLFIAISTACVVFFRRSIGAGLRRILIKTDAPEVIPAAIVRPQEVIIKIEQPQPLAPPFQIREPAESVNIVPAIPRPPVVGFVARRDSEGRDIVDRLKRELEPEKNQLIVLSGPGGVGKTTLGAEATRALIEVFGDRIVWISALGREDFSLSTLLDEIATQLGEPGLRTLALALKTEQVQALIASAATLIILDNFETIRPAEQTHCVEFLLNHATCPALITTRWKIASARNVVIPVMSPDEANTFLQLLIDQATDPDAFAQVDLGRVMKASDRNPLVLQWVVAQIDLAQDADSVLDDLAHGVGDAAQRVFDRSFGLAQLGDDGRAALLALSLFAPDASRTALAEVAGFGEDMKRLNEAVKGLARLFLVKMAAEGTRLVVEGLTREFAKARLSTDGRTKEYQRRFYSHFLGYARSHSQPTAEDYDSLEPEKDNLIASIDIAIGLDDWETIYVIVASIANPVTGVLAVHGYWEETAKLNALALEASRHHGSESDKAIYAHNLAVTRGNQGELDQARRLYNESLEIAKRLGDDGGIAITLHQLAILAQDQGELDEARRLYHESLEIEKRRGNDGGIAISLHQLAILAQDQGELDEARRLYEESLEIANRLGIQNMIASSLHQLGRLAEDEGNLAEARRLYGESHQIQKRLGSQDGIATSLHQLALLAQGEGKLDEARRLYGESLEIEKKLGNQSGIARTTSQLGIVHLILGEWAESRLKHEGSLAIRRKLGDLPGIAIDLHQLGRIAEGEGNNEEATRLFAEALGICEKLKSPNAEVARQSLERVKGKLS